MAHCCALHRPHCTGIRGAPRDALIADISPPEVRGATFGLRQSLDTVGSFLGPLLAILLMWATVNSFTTVFRIAVIPAFLSLGLILLTVREPERPPGLRIVKSPLSRAELARLDAAYWRMVAVATVFTLARFSEAFLILRALSVGLSIALVPAVLVLMKVVYALAAYPAGARSDRIDRRTVLIAGLMLLVVADMVLALASGIAGVVIGMFNLLTGLALLAASTVAGALWDVIGPKARSPPGPSSRLSRSLDYWWSSDLDQKLRYSFDDLLLNFNRSGQPENVASSNASGHHTSGSALWREGSFRGATDLLQAATLCVMRREKPRSRCMPSCHEMPMPRGDAENLSAVSAAGGN